MEIRRRYPDKIKNLMIVGGGRITYYLYKLLNDMNIKIKIIEIDKARCEELSEKLPNALIINGDGTDEEVLLSENIEHMDAFLFVTGIDEENFMSSLIAKRVGVKKIITKLSRANYINIIRDVGLDGIVIPKRITTNKILKFTRCFDLQSLRRILEGKVEILEFVVDNSSKLINKEIEFWSFLYTIIILIVLGVILIRI
ncbi:NAD-binding protein [Clostridium intestinale]|uniref:NAD-binding protein n=1 Tax=Clostridium intestinale TaxID=36845 RepID=UPI0003F4AE53|nr:NAD-binding protein [Clostridium intestinale]